MQKSPADLENLSEADIQPICAMVRAWFSLLRSVKGIPLYIGTSLSLHISSYNQMSRLKPKTSICIGDNARNLLMKDCKYYISL